MKEKNHVVDHLCAFLDGELPPQTAKLVSEHLAGCADCRGMLEDLRGVSKLVAGLPKKPLPSGFMTRFKARQAREAAASEKPGLSFFSWTPQVRAAAMALSALVVAFVAYEGMHGRGAPDMPGQAKFSETDAGTDLNANRSAAMEELRKAAASAPLAKDAAEAKADKGLAQVALGPKSEVFRMKAKAFGSIAASVGRGAGGSAAAAAPAPPALAGGSAFGEAAPAEPRYSNAELQGMLETEKKRMGITAIEPPRESRLPTDEEWTGSPNPDRQDIAVRRPPARLEGDTPAIITPTSLQTPAAPGGVALSPPGIPEGRTFSPVKAGRQARATDLLAGPSAEALSGQPAEDVRAFGRLEVLAARSQEELDAVWLRHGIVLPKPSLDFSRHMLIVVPPSEEDNSACDISSANETASAVLIRCRRRESSYAARPVAVSFRIVPLSALPLKLETVK